MSDLSLEVQQGKLALKLSDFEGPLDLLLHLISQNRVDIYHIPISEITDQYMEILEQSDLLDLHMASEFLLMAATLTQIKSRMLLPLERNDEGEIIDDPRDELVLRLLAYRRCKMIAKALSEAYERYHACAFRQAETRKSLGLPEPKGEDRAPEDLSQVAFFAAAEQLSARNRARYQDLRDKTAYILRRERFSLRRGIFSLWDRIKKGTRLCLNDWIETKKRTQKVGYFLALLELLKQNRVEVEQESHFAPIYVNRLAGVSDDLDERLLPEDED